jgi:hypothetical protein
VTVSTLVMGVGVQEVVWSLLLSASAALSGGDVVVGFWVVLVV